MTWILLLCTARAGPLPGTTTQLVLVVVEDRDSSYATLQRLQRDVQGWRRVGQPMAARVGAAGVAWGVGLHPPQPGLQKTEGDLRSPEGLFLLGEAFRDPTVPPRRAAWPIRLVGERDLWVEDPGSPFYNQHLVVTGDRLLLPWENAARMTLGDPTLALKVRVDHNPPPAIAGAGSAIFLHSLPPDDLATAGCTALTRADLETVIDWLGPEATPVFALLTRADLETFARPWDLPAP